MKGEDGESDSDGSNSAPSPSPPSSLPCSSPSSLLGVAHISVGALLRRASSPSDTTLPASSRALIQRVIGAGGIVPGALTVELLGCELRSLQQRQRELNPALRLVVLVDGFPRSMDNVAEFERQLGPVRHMLLLECDEEEMRRRLRSRGRSDDTDEIIQKRFEGYRTQTQQVIDWFKERATILSAPQLKQLSTATSSPPSAPSVPSSPSSPSRLLFVIDGRPAIPTVTRDMQQALDFMTKL